MLYLRWVTPRIRYCQITDDLGHQYYDIAYNVWDIKTDKPFEKILHYIKHGLYRYANPATCVPIDVPVKEPDTREKQFYDILSGSLNDQINQRFPDKQFIRDMGLIYCQCPEIVEPVENDVQEFLKEEPEYREEWEKWYRQALYDTYRKPHFYRDDLAGKIPIDADDEEVRDYHHQF